MPQPPPRVVRGDRPPCNGPTRPLSSPEASPSAAIAPVSWPTRGHDQRPPSRGHDSASPGRLDRQPPRPVTARGLPPHGCNRGLAHRGLPASQPPPSPQPSRCSRDLSAPRRHAAATRGPSSTAATRGPAPQLAFHGLPAPRLRAGPHPPTQGTRP